MKTLRLTLLTLVINQLSIINCNAQWQETSGPGGDDNVNCIVTNGNNVFAGTNSGVFLSTDNGSSWTSVNSGLTNVDVYSLAINGSNIFAGTYGGGVFFSSNNGASWTASDSGLTATYIYSLAIRDSQVLAAGLGTVFVSANNGISWTGYSTGLPAEEGIQALAFSGKNIFAGLETYGMYLSTDSGVSWILVDSGIPAIHGVNQLAIIDSNIFASVSGVYLSTDNGGVWNPVNAGLLNPDIIALTVCNPLPNGKAGVFACSNSGSIFLTTDNGTTWSGENAGLITNGIESLGANDSYLFGGEYNGYLWRRSLADIISGLHEVPSAVQIQVYPNPSVGNWQLSVANELVGSALEVFDAQGRMVMKLEVRNTQYELTANTWASGVYYLRISNANGSVVRKLVKL